MNRVGDVYRDQLRLTGHHDRPGDLAVIAALGVKALRFPVLWERVAPDQHGAPDWAWSDTALAELDRLDVRPILGLLHHGSGPAHTDLLADNFVPAFAAYAAEVATRYPQVIDWTPINEPLTTARFSALYGAWYPHARDRWCFFLAVLQQAEATAAAMRAIRGVQPAARLIQTDDLGRTYAEAGVEDVADYYNSRRWLCWDLLAGRVLPGHFWWQEATELGFAARVRALADAPCPPDVIGLNHYPTSDRYLRARAAGEGGERFDDLEALRAMPEPPAGLAGALREAWDRYGIPLAITETHLGCTREEQLRWLKRSWDTAVALAREGVDVRAVTGWALMGNVDWTSLITEDRGHYEPGAFDVRGGAPRPTAIARLLGAIERPEAEPLLHDLAAQRGWWERPIRLGDHAAEKASVADVLEPAPRLLITGATGTLGQAFAGACRLRGLDYILTDRVTLPIDDADAIARMLDAHRPWALVNAAGWVRVDDAEADEDACFAANADGAILLAEACAARGIACALFSSDLVFGGATDGPHDERAAPAPLGAYGRSKAAMERRALQLDPPPLVVRTAAFFSPFDPHNFAMQVERALAAGETILASDGHVVSPTYLPDLVAATLDLLIDGETGLWHLTHGEPVSWLTFGRHVAVSLGFDPAGVVAAEPDDLGWRARRPRHAGLRAGRGRVLPTLGDAVANHAAERLRARGGGIGAIGGAEAGR